MTPTEDGPRVTPRPRVTPYRPRGQVTPTEDGLWAIAMQLLSAVHAVHASGAVHVSHPSTCHARHASHPTVHVPRPTVTPVHVSRPTVTPVHVSGSAVRSLDASHVILTDRNTVRVSQSGIADVMRPERRSVQQLQARPRVTLVHVSPPSTCHRPTMSERSAGCWSPLHALRRRPRQAPRCISPWRLCRRLSRRICRP